jgi:hypothetical protein
MNQIGNIANEYDKQSPDKQESHHADNLAVINLCHEADIIARDDLINGSVFLIRMNYPYLGYSPQLLCQVNFRL